MHFHKGNSPLPHLGSYTAPAGIEQQRAVGLGRVAGIAAQQKAQAAASEVFIESRMETS